MQTIELDLTKKLPNEEDYPVIHTKQGDVGRKFKAVITDAGEDYAIPEGTVFSVWYFGTSGEGNYSYIGEESACKVEGNNVTVELITQMLTNDGGGSLCLIMNLPDGSQIGCWNIPYAVEKIRGAESAEAKAYYTALTEFTEKAMESAEKAEQAAASLETDKTLSVPGMAADAAAAGEAIRSLALTIYPVGSIYLSVSGTSPESLFGGTWEQMKDRFLLGAGDSYAPGTTGGEAEHLLTASEMPTHSHIMNRIQNATIQTGGTHKIPTIDDWSQGTTTTGATGSGQAHNNMPPYLVVYMWKRIA